MFVCGHEYLKVSDVGEEEAEEGEGQGPLGHGADDVSRVALGEEQADVCEPPPSQRGHAHRWDTPTFSPGVQCSLWVTSTPTRVLYMMTEDTNTGQRSRVTAPETPVKSTSAVSLVGHMTNRILLTMLHSVQSAMARRARKTALLWMWGCMRSDSSVWTRM